jgi:hypothetical protein
MENNRTIVYRDKEGYDFVVYGKVELRLNQRARTDVVFHVDGEALLKHEGPNGEPGKHQSFKLSHGWWSTGSCTPDRSY